jgi:hypothetical protein
MAERVAREALVAEVPDRVRVEDSVCLVEFGLELELPLAHQVRRHDHQRTAGRAACPQFLDDHSRLDGLAEADLVTEEQAVRVAVDHSMHDGDLVGLEVHARGVERNEFVVKMLELVVSGDRSEVELLRGPEFLGLQPLDRVDRCVRPQVGLANGSLPRGKQNLPSQRDRCCAEENPQFACGDAPDSALQLDRFAGECRP